MMTTMPNLIGKKRIPKPLNEGEECLALQLRTEKLKPEREYKFHPDKRWKFDFAFLEQKLAIEIEGGIYSGGRHVRGKGYQADMAKYNAASALGWRLLRYTPAQIKTGQPLKEILRLLNARRI